MAYISEVSLSLLPGMIVAASAQGHTAYSTSKLRSPSKQANAFSLLPVKGLSVMAVEIS